jgi:hypothetical protein
MQSIKNTGHFNAFNKTWFEKHQRGLLWLLNFGLTRKWFKWILRIRKYDIGYDKNIVRLLPNCYTIFNRVVGDRIELATDFRTHAKYAKRIYYAFKPLWWVMHYWDLVFADKYVPELSFGFAVLTVWPDPSPEVTSVDGSTSQEYAVTSGVSWATIIAGAGVTANDNSSVIYAFYIGADSTLNQWIYLFRGIFLFDTSALADNAVISGGIFSLYGNTKSDNGSYNGNLNVYSSTPASNIAIVAGDFDSLGSTAFSDTALAYADMSATAYNNFTLNASGLAAISLTGISKFGTRNANYDVAAVSPTWLINGSNTLQIKSADTGGTSTDPKLEVTYEVLPKFPPPNKLRPRIFSPGVAR